MPGPVGGAAMVCRFEPGRSINSKPAARKIEDMDFIICVV